MWTNLAPILWESTLQTLYMVAMSALIGTLLAETKLSNRGIGFLIIQAYSLFDMPRMYAMLIVLFVLAILASAFGGLSVMLGLFATKSVGGAIAGLFAGPIVFVLYVILARVWMETLIVLFRIAENTAKIAGRGEQGQGQEKTEK